MEIGDELSEVKRVKYLGLILQKDGSFKENIKHMVKCKWMK